MPSSQNRKENLPHEFRFTLSSAAWALCATQPDGRAYRTLWRTTREL